MNQYKIGLEAYPLHELKEDKAFFLISQHFLWDIFSIFRFFLVLLSMCMISTRSTRSIGRYSNTLPPKMPLLVNGIHKDIYR